MGTAGPSSKCMQNALLLNKLGWVHARHRDPMPTAGCSPSARCSSSLRSSFPALTQSSLQSSPDSISHSWHIRGKPHWRPQAERSSTRPMRSASEVEDKPWHPPKKQLTGTPLPRLGKASHSQDYRHIARSATCAPQLGLSPETPRGWKESALCLKYTKPGCQGKKCLCSSHPGSKMHLHADTSILKPIRTWMHLSPAQAASCKHTHTHMPPHACKHMHTASSPQFAPICKSHAHGHVDP